LTSGGLWHSLLLRRPTGCTFHLGLELVRKIGSDIDVVISDINLPKLDGIQLANLVRAEFPKIPIILVSG
jgi:YesN/AraC family two-component response regulator